MSGLYNEETANQLLKQLKTNVVIIRCEDYEKDYQFLENQFEQSLFQKGFDPDNLKQDKICVLNGAEEYGKYKKDSNQNRPFRNYHKLCIVLCPYNEISKIETEIDKAHRCRIDLYDFINTTEIFPHNGDGYKQVLIDYGCKVKDLDTKMKKEDYEVGAFYLGIIAKQNNEKEAYSSFISEKLLFDYKQFISFHLKKIIKGDKVDDTNQKVLEHFFKCAEDKVLIEFYDDLNENLDNDENLRKVVDMLNKDSEDYIALKVSQLLHYKRVLNGADIKPLELFLKENNEKLKNLNCNYLGHLLCKQLKANKGDAKLISNTLKYCDEVCNHCHNEKSQCFM